MDIAGEDSAACAVREDGAVRCWGLANDPIPDDFRAKVAAVDAPGGGGT